MARVTDISNSGISVDLPFQTVAGDLVELEMADSTLYGQVVYSNVVYSNKESSLFRTGIEASRVLLGGTELSSILQRVLMDAVPEMPGLETTGVHRD